jgi:hypothetical protein
MTKSLPNRIQGMFKLEEVHALLPDVVAARITDGIQRGVYKNAFGVRSLSDYVSPRTCTEIIEDSWDGLRDVQTIRDIFDSLSKLQEKESALDDKGMKLRCTLFQLKIVAMGML